MVRIAQGMTFILAMALGIAGTAVGAKTQPRADEQIYDCNMTTGADNLIPGRVLIIRDLATNQISVFDGLIKYLQDKPMVAKVKVDSPTRLELGWTVKHLPLTKGAEGMGIFALTFIKGDLRAHESVVLAGYDNAENRSGTCVLAK